MNFLFLSVGPEASLEALQFLFGGTRWRRWFRHCATSQKVAGSNPDGAVFDSASKKNEDREYFLKIKAAGK